MLMTLKGMNAGEKAHATRGMTEREKAYLERITELETENGQLRDLLHSAVGESTDLAEEMSDMQEEFAGAYGKLETELAKLKKERGIAP